MSVRKSGHATGMAGEFFVMERLYRLGHQPALTLGNAKTIDILTKSRSGRRYEVSVKAACGGGKWGVGDLRDLHNYKVLVFVFLRYRPFGDPSTNPEVWVIPVADVNKLKRPWFPGGYAIFFSNEEDRQQIERYKDAWQKYLA